MATPELVIALGTLSIGVLGLLISQREAIVPLYRHRSGSLLYVGATAVMLALSPILAAFVAGRELRPSVPVFFVQALGVTWGLGLLLTPLGGDLVLALRDTMDPRIYQWLGPGISFVAILAAVVLAAQAWPWWLMLAWLAMSALVTTLRVRYGSPVERLLSRPPDEA